jgi:glycosyltransferase involved in cell wall biosynthesis
VALAAAIDDALALDVAKLKHLGENGRARVSEKFTAQAMCEQTLAFYSDLLARRRS